MKPLRFQLKRRLRKLSGGWIGAIMLVIGIAVLFVGHVLTRGWTFAGLVGDLYSNVGTDLFGIALVILIVDRLNLWREEDNLKRQLIREMGSGDHGLATQAVLELEARGWLYDDTLSKVWLVGSNLSSIRMERAHLSGAMLAGANLEAANLSRARLDRCNLSAARLRDVNLEMADLTKANLQDADLERADMARSVLVGTNLAGASLRETDLSDSDLTGADLRNADLTGCRLAGAKTEQVLWAGARGVPGSAGEPSIEQP